MALITRCPVCGTQFKVVPDQLRISEGWVRCGHCGEVFDASGDLQQSDLQQHDILALDTLPPPVEAGIFLHAPEPIAAPPSLYSETQIEPFGMPVLPEPPPVALDEPHPAAHQELDEILEWPEPPLLTDGTDEAHHAVAETKPAQAQIAAAGDTPASVIDLEPVSPAEEELAGYSFVRASDSRAEGRRPWVGWFWGGSALLLLVVLGVQGIVHGRDRMAANWPEMRPWLHTLCSSLGCSVSALRQIDSIVIDSSTLSILPSEDIYRLNMVLKNQAMVDLAMPSVECVFTDSDEQAVFRRVLSPAELGAASRVLFARREWSTSVDLRVTDSVGKGRIVGYRLLAFYP